MDRLANSVVACCADLCNGGWMQPPVAMAQQAVSNAATLALDAMALAMTMALVLGPV